VTTGPSHDELREMIPAAALEILDSSDLHRVVAHTRGCAECSQALEEYREVAFALATLPPLREPPHSATLRARILARVRQNPQHTRFTRAAVGGMWMGWTVAAGLAGVLLMHHAVHRPLDYGWLASGALALVLVATAVYALIQRNRVSALRDRLASLERETGPGHERVGP
jgi:hypothetical protein